MVSELFIDTSGFYALLVGGDERHDAAADIFRRAAATKRRLVTTEYVVDETANLLQARGMPRLATRLFAALSSTSACSMAWIDVERFERTRALFLRSLERGWSFTDCMSFVVMKELRLKEALTKDEHFAEVGFAALLA